MKMNLKNTFRGLLVLSLAALLGAGFAACSSDETYADQKKKERSAVAAFVEREPLLLLDSQGDTLLFGKRIKVISEEQFEAQDSMTNVEENEYVLFESNGVYMQIVRKGTGEKLKHGETATLACRYWEYNILGDSLATSNMNSTYTVAPDYVQVTNSYGSFTGSFDTSIYPGGGAMYRIYSSTSVPAGWLVPLTYIRLGRQSADGIAKVRLIVPHSQGTSTATSGVYPMFYEITYQRTL